MSGQVDDLLVEIRDRAKKNERVLCTTLTKRMAEDLTDYYRELGVRIRYLHSDIDTLERIDILRDLRLGEFDVLVGINLLREGLDLPEVSLVAIFDADKEGFLRSPRSLIQTIGRAARNVNGRVIMYADGITPAMKQAMDETARRRVIQEKYNTDHGIIPQTVIRAVTNLNPASGTTDYFEIPKVPKSGARKSEGGKSDVDLTEQIRALRTEMFTAAENLEFEKAARMRDELKRLEALAGSGEADAGTSTYNPYEASPKKAKASARSSEPKKASAKRKAAGRWKR